MSTTKEKVKHPDFQAIEKKITINPLDFNRGDEVVFYHNGRWQQAVLLGRPVLSGDQKSVTLRYLADIGDPHSEVPVTIKNDPRKVAFKRGDTIRYQDREAWITKTMVNQQGETVYSLNFTDDGSRTQGVIEGALVADRMLGEEMSDADRQAAEVERVRAGLLHQLQYLKGKKRLEFMASFQNLLKDLEETRRQVTDASGAYYDEENYRISQDAVDKLNKLKSTLQDLPNKFTAAVQRLRDDIESARLEQMAAENPPPPNPNAPPGTRAPRLEKPVFSFEDEKKQLLDLALSMRNRAHALGQSERPLRDRLNGHLEVLQKIDDKAADVQARFITILKELHNEELQLLRLENVPEKKERLINIPPEIMDDLLSIDPRLAYEVKSAAYHTALVDSHDATRVVEKLKNLFRITLGEVAAGSFLDISNKMAEHTLSAEMLLAQLTPAVLEKHAKLELARAHQELGYWVARELHQARGDNRSLFDVAKTSGSKPDLTQRFEEWQATSPIFKMKSALGVKYGVTAAAMLGVGLVARAIANRVLPVEAVGAAVGGAAALAKTGAQEFVAEREREDLPQDASWLEKGARWGAELLDKGRKKLVKAEKDAKKAAKKEKLERIVKALLEKGFVRTNSGEMEFFENQNGFSPYRREMAHLLSTSLRHATAPGDERIARLRNSGVELSDEQAIITQQALKHASLGEGLEIGKVSTLEWQRTLGVMQNNDLITSSGEFELPEHALAYRMNQTRSLLDSTDTTTKKNKISRYAMSLIFGVPIGYAFTVANNTLLRVALGGGFAFRRGYQNEVDVETGKADAAAREQVKKDLAVMEEIMEKTPQQLGDGDIEMLRDYRNLFRAILNKKKTELKLKGLSKTKEGKKARDFYATHAWDVDGLLLRDKEARDLVESHLLMIESRGYLLKLGFKKTLEDMQEAGDHQEENVMNTWGVRWWRVGTRLVKGAAYGVVGAASAVVVGLGFDTFRELQVKANAPLDRADADDTPDASAQSEHAKAGAAVPPDEKPDVVLHPAHATPEITSPQAFVSWSLAEFSDLVRNGQMTRDQLFDAIKDWQRVNPHSFDQGTMDDFRTWMRYDRVGHPDALPNRIDGHFITPNQDHKAMYDAYIKSHPGEDVVMPKTQKVAPAPWPKRPGVVVPPVEPTPPIKHTEIIPPVEHPYRLSMAEPGVIHYRAGGVDHTFKVDPQYEPEISDGGNQLTINRHGFSVPGSISLASVDGELRPVFEVTGEEGDSITYFFDSTGAIDLLDNGTSTQLV